MSWGVVAHAPVTISPDGEPTFVTSADDPWGKAFQGARKVDAEAIKRLCSRATLNTWGYPLHVVDLGD